MSIWFVYRCAYDGPMSKHVRRFDGADTLLDWFRSIWQAIPDIYAARDHADALLGTHVYSFGCLFTQIAEFGWPVPQTMQAVHDALESALYVNEYRGSDDTIQVLTDDDELQMAMYWFTDDFARAHPERVAYLLRQDWRLPEVVGPGGFRPVPGVRRLLPPVPSEKALYLVDLYWSDSSDLEDLGAAEKLPGLRLADLVGWLLTLSIEQSEDLGGVVANLREHLEKVMAGGEGLEASFRRALKEQPGDVATWSAYTDWLAERDLPRAELYLLEQTARVFSARYANHPDFDPASLRLQVAPHALALMRPQQGDVFDQWYLFDDVWASGNVDLANALLDYNLRFNVLDDPGVRNEHGPDLAPGEERGPA